MKRLKNIFALVAGIFLLASCEELDNILPGDKAPAEIKNDLAERHPNAEDVEWEKEGNLWEAEFEENSVEVSVIYDADLNWVRTERDIPIDELPENVKDYIATNFPDGKLEEAASFESYDEGNGFVVEVSNDGMEYELFFDEEGEFIRQEIEEED
ncbi:PepSY-like domain-containing protein [Nafulsella turpanensis]|uniref:PepSY-like domain-containing protein n=1 Tax=Nafulsella turpanensis TaxID=1265690 RepID=UPI000349DA8E|nr:PepSY-like domain-containing protein [Nafulsella turpanensis]